MNNNTYFYFFEKSKKWTKKWTKDWTDRGVPTTRKGRGIYSTLPSLGNWRV
jgi:hypothetical protein